MGVLEIINEVHGKYRYVSWTALSDLAHGESLLLNIYEDKLYKDANHEPLLATTMPADFESWLRRFIWAWDNAKSEFAKKLIQKYQENDSEALLYAEYTISPVANPKLDKQIRKLIAAKNKAKFKDFAALKSGNDKFSKIRLEVLLTISSPAVIEHAKTVFGDDPGSLAKVLRWVLRGLPCDLAVRKVATDNEIASNILNKHN